MFSYKNYLCEEIHIAIREEIHIAIREEIHIAIREEIHIAIHCRILLPQHHLRARKRTRKIRRLRKGTRLMVMMETMIVQALKSTLRNRWLHKGHQEAKLLLLHQRYAL